MKIMENAVILDRFDYDELVSKANATDKKIEEQADKISKDRDTIPVRIEFNQYRNSKNFNSLIDFERHYDSDEVWKALDKIEPEVCQWMDENLSEYKLKLRDMNITERNCIGLSKRVDNLEQRLRIKNIKFTFLSCYAVAISIVVFFLLDYLK